MTVRALKKKNKMTGPFKMKGSPMARNFGIGASPVRKDGEGYADTIASAKRMVKRNQELTVQDNMQDTTDSGSFDQAFAAARKADKKTFTYKGKSYNTKLKK